MKNENNIEKVIQNYETRLTGILTGAGYKYSVLLDAYNFAARNTDISITRPDLCLKFKVPFIKIKSFVYFSYPKYTIALLKENTRYPVDFIFNYLNQVYDPDTTLFIQDKLLINGVKNTHAPPDKRAAIHLHVYYPEILDKFMILDNTNANFDLYITTDTREKKEIIYDLLKDHVYFSKLKEIIILENQGRDIVPWLSIKEILNQYDIVGHFHTKKHSLAENWIGVTWLDDLLHSLLYDINNIFSEFHRNGSLGIIIAEVPYIFRKLFLPGFSASFNKMLSDTWKRLKCTKRLDFSRTKNIIMPIGNMFWYRPAALKPLFEMRLPPEDIPREPIQRETILHSIEHLLVYIAWNEGYDYRISLSPNIRDSNFVDMYRVYSTADALTGSLTYRTGKFFLALPKAVLRMLRKFKP
jgi:rhamnosyltransferase